VRADLPAPGEGILHRLLSLPFLPKFRYEILVAAGFDEPSPSGSVFAFDNSGTKLWEISYRDALGPIAERFGQDWAVEKWMVYSVSGRRRIALVFRNQTQWPSVLVVLDDGGHAIGQFVNAGRITGFDLFTTPTRYLFVVNGTSVSRDAGMVAFVDVSQPSGTSPEESGSPYDCATCSPGRPIKYLIFPRSELNRVTGSPVNDAAYLGVANPGRMTEENRWAVGTKETADDRKNNLTAEGIYHSLSARYVFGPDFETLQGTSFDDDHWEAHHQLELRGRINHSKAQCPEQNGPPLARVWDAQGGWRELRPSGR